MCGPKFCSMKITQDVRDYAATQGVQTDAETVRLLDLSPPVDLEAEMQAKAREFREQGSQLYSKV
jgi:phosphomethylpyrimidine synthase